MKKSPKSLSFVDFKKIQGKRPLSVKRGRFFSIAFFPDENMRFSFVVSKKKTKKAVSRNRIKRKSKACLLEILQSGEPKTGFYVINAIISGIEDVTHEELLQEIKSLLSL